MQEEGSQAEGRSSKGGFGITVDCTVWLILQLIRACMLPRTGFCLGDISSALCVHCKYGVGKQMRNAGLM